MRRCKEAQLRPALVFACLLSCQVQAASIANRFEIVETKLLHLLATNEYQQAIEYATAQQVEFTGSGYENHLAYWLAISFARQGQLLQAQQQFERIQPDPALPLLDYEQALLYIRQGRFNEAIGHLLAFEPRGIKPQATGYYLALAHFELRQFEEAEVWLEALPSFSDPESVDLLKDGKGDYLRAANYFELKEWSAAENLAGNLSQSDSPYADEADRLLLQLRNIRRDERSLKLAVTASAAGDSNVPLQPDLEQADIRTAVLLEASYQLTDWLTPGYQFYSSRHAHFEAYNLMNNSLVMRVDPVPGIHNLAANYSLAVDHLNQLWWQTRHQLSANYALNAMRVDASFSLQHRESGRRYGLYGAATAPFELPLMNGVPAQVTADLELNMTDALALIHVKPALALQVQHQIQRWLIDGNLSLSYRIDAPSVPTDSVLGVAMTGQIARRWNAHWQTAVKADWQAGVVEPESLSYSRTIITGQVTWSY